MTDDNTTQVTTGDSPAVAESVSLESNRMSADDPKAVEQAIARKFRIRELEAKVQELETKIGTLTKERDDAVMAADETKAAYEEFTNENAMQMRIDELEKSIRYRDMMDTFNNIEGVEYQAGVTLDDLFAAAGVDFDAMEDIPEDFTTAVIEAAKAKKPFLFASSGSAETQTGEVRQESAAPVSPTLRAFGGQAAGGGAAPPSPKADPAQAVDWKNPEAINRYVASQG